MKIFSANQIKACDRFTIENEPIASIDLMERAAMACIKHLIRAASVDEEFVIFCGKGNNGGDGLAIARHLIVRGYAIKVFVINHQEKYSEDCKTNLDRLLELKADAVTIIENESQLSTISVNPSGVIVDALFGTGINKPINGICENVVDFINALGLKVISIDMPSGLYADKSNEKEDCIIRATLVLTFQFPKLSFMMAQNQFFVPQFEILDIELSKIFIEKENTAAYFVTKSDILPLLKYRSKFSHKGSFGHAMLISGTYGKMGAAVIAAKACLRSGAGLLTVHVPAKGVEVIQSSIPEAMVSVDINPTIITELPKLDKINAIGIGPGIGTKSETESVIKKLLSYSSAPIVFDADAITILADNKTWLSFLPANSVLTPHVKEFDRLTEKHENDFDRLNTARQFALKYNCILILKATYTLITMPDGNCFFNSTGNPGLAKGGSGDALTGIITGLIARGYSTPQAALLGVYIHGYAADLCLKKINMESLLVSDVIAKLPKAFEKLYDKLTG